MIGFCVAPQQSKYRLTALIVFQQVVTISL